MCAVGHYLEEEGIATTLISLVKEHSDAMRPPRALWVPFMLGRPFGVPEDAAFQTRVLRAALSLLDAPEGPASADFPEEAPAETGEDAAGDACPVNFARVPEQGDGPDAEALTLQAEIGQLRPWYDIAQARSGRTTVGVSGGSPETAAAFITSQLQGALPTGDDASAWARRIKLACDDLRAYYEEAGAAQPGRLSPAALERWYYLGTTAGAVLHRLRQKCLESNTPALKHLGQLVLIPRAILHGSTAE